MGKGRRGSRGGLVVAEGRAKKKTKGGEKGRQGFGFSHSERRRRGPVAENRTSGHGTAAGHSALLPFQGKETTATRGRALPSFLPSFFSSIPFIGR